jgi:hypothetical protein
MGKIRERKSRAFKYYDPITNLSRGTYYGKSPKQAASKCFTRFLRGNTTQNSAVICIKEATKGKNNKIFKYSCKRNKLQHPIEVLMRGSRVIYRHKNSIRAFKQ